MRNSVVIMSVGRKVSLVRAFKEAGWRVIGDDKDKTSIGLRFCDNVLQNIKGYHKSDYFWVPTRDAEVADAWSINDSENSWTETINTCLDKFKFYKWCKKHGFNTPEVYFVKPRVSSSGKEVDCVWQELIEGEEHSVDLFSDFNKRVISVVPRKRVKVITGESAITTTVANKRLLGESVSLATYLGLIGHNTLQCFVQKSKIVWTDVNCRFGGASIVGIMAGCKSPEWLLSLWNGEKVKPQIGKYIVGLTGKSYTNWEFCQNGG